MASKKLFSSRKVSRVPVADTVNEAGGVAYGFSPEHALAQYAATGCLSKTFYASEDDQLDKVLAIAEKVSPQFVAKTAVFARERGYMKDMPALLCAILAKDNVEILKKVFHRVIDNGRMLRNFVQIIRSGKCGRKSFGTAPRRMIREWLAGATDKRLIEASVGNDPSLADVVKMVHPKPRNKAQEAFYGWLSGRSTPRGACRSS